MTSKQRLTPPSADEICQATRRAFCVDYDQTPGHHRSAARVNAVISQLESWTPSLIPELASQDLALCLKLAEQLDSRHSALSFYMRLHVAFLAWQSICSARDPALLLAAYDVQPYFSELLQLISFPHRERTSAWQVRASLIAPILYFAFSDLEASANETKSAYLPIARLLKSNFEQDVIWGNGFPI